MASVAGAEWISWIFTAVFVGVALFFAVRLLASRRDVSGSGCSTDRSSTDPSADVSHGVMSLGMAAMFWPWGNPMQGNPVPALYWQVLFGMAAAWFAVRLLRRGARSAPIPQPGLDRGDLHHVLGSLAMVYMLAAVPAGHGVAHGTHMPGISGPGIALPTLAWAFVGYFLVSAVWLGARLVEPVHTVAASRAGAVLLDGGPRDVIISSHLVGSCRVVMGIGMSYMLVTML